MPLELSGTKDYLCLLTNVCGYTGITWAVPLPSPLSPWVMYVSGCGQPESR